ncbi:MAG: autoinducer binding domain-containing protein [Bdellovibrionales bacterium]
MATIEENIDLLSKAKDAASAFKIYSKAMDEFGYDKISYTLCTDHPSLNLSKQHGLSTSYPDDWMSHYTKNSFLKIDPVVSALLNTRAPFFWDEVIDEQDRDSAAFALMQDAEDAGVADGIGISFRTPYQEITGIGIARSERASRTQSYENLATIYFLTSYFHETYRNLVVPPKKVELTARELDVLSWAIEGKTDDDISQIMSISFHTVRFHWKNIFEKLDTFNKVHAVSKALRLRLITPGLITY